MNSQIVETLWRRSGQGVGFISSLNRNTGEWSDVPYEWKDPAEFIQQEGCDIFFTPLTYEKPRRLDTLHMPASVLFADLDPVDPRDIIRPHIAWETSPGSYQAIWYLSEPVKYRTAWADLNRRLTYTVEADRGGWSGSKVLRVPGTRNYKRDGEPGKLLWWDETQRPYTYGELDHKLIPLSEIKVGGVPVDAPDIITDRKKLDEIWARMPPGAQWELTRTKVSDRSLHIVRTAHKLREAGVSLEDAYHMLWYAPYNKWRLRNNQQRLWIEVSNVYQN